ncbi:MAG: hypothetical protein ACRD4K_05810 [Candidatus Acidiferrales bacterium]
MKKRAFSFGMAAGCAAIALFSASAPCSAQAPAGAAVPNPPPYSSGGKLVDRIAVRIEDDIIAESAIRELIAYQELMGQKAEPRPEVVQHLIDQWIFETEAATARFPQPSENQVNEEFDQIVKRFPSPDAFRARMAALGLPESALRRMLRDEIYLSRFLDYKFRPAAQVDPGQIETYYKETLAPELKSKGQPVPPLADVTAQIREILIEKDINERSSRWLDETRARLKIDITPGELGS